jgi:quercetin dioxygenase-like cupin family protein
MTFWQFVLMIFSLRQFSRSLSSVLALVALGACSSARQPAPAPSAPPEIRVMSSSSGAVPQAGAVTRTTVYESPRTVTQVLRIAPGGRIAEHHHPSYDETFLVQQGRLTLILNGKTYELGPGEFVVMQAGTVIAGMNSGAEEVRAVVAFSNNGSPGPLTVPGSPHH